MSVTGFLEIERQDRAYRPVAERLKDWRECVQPAGPEQVARQAERCMTCGVPFCHIACPVNNQIPDWNGLVSEQDWQAAIDRLHATNNFPEFTGRVCPAPCEAACTLNLEDRPVTIKSIEQEIADRGWNENWIRPRLAPRGTGKRVAIVGSGPAGLACAQQLARLGHNATVFEKADRIGGLLRYGIPDFKMEKFLIDRRVAQMEQEGVLFRTRVEVGRDLPLDRLLDDYQAVVLAGGAESPRDLAVPGRDLAGVHFAMDYLTQQNRRGCGDPEALRPISAEGKHVVVIGGGDTGSDCVGTANRQGAASVTQLEILAEPPESENKALTWPYWPLKLRTSSSHQEGCQRDFTVITEAFVGAGKVERLRCRRLDNDQAFDLQADLVLLAMGFTGTPFDGASAGLDTANGTIRAEFGNYATSRDRVFACGDMRRGQSLVVWAIREGRDCAAMVHQALAAA